MGIPGLTGLLKRHAPQSLIRTVAPQYQGQTLAIDVSCPLSRYIYGDDPHPFRHLHGFYLLIKFCERHHIKPIFVFDGTERIIAKQQWEHRRRARNQHKIKESLIFEQSRSTRLASWLTATESEYLSMLTSESIQRLLDQLSGDDDGVGRLKSTAEYMDLQPPPPDNNKEAQQPSWNETLTLGDSALTLKEAKLHVKEHQKALEEKLSTIVKELHETNQYVQDRDRYTKTVRDLSNQEYDLMNTMIRNRLESVHDNLVRLKGQNDRLLTSYAKRSLKVTKDIKRDCYSFLSSLGYPCFVCENHEAEAMCASLVRNGNADGIISEDMDSIVFGDGPLLRYFCTKNKPILHVDPVVARQQLGLTRAEFLDLCILCGTDFGSKIYGIGPNRALELVKQHGSIEEILIHLDPRKYIPEEGFDYLLIRKVFQELPSIPTHPSTDKLSSTPSVNSDTLNNLLQQYQIDPDEIDTQLDIFMHQQNRPSLAETISSPGDSAFGSNPFQQPHSSSHSDTPLFT
ncbi:PIN domain-like protein [Absidia repens]|uniref:PIN domain-like protein n=1 Tax=Absidia repens TaxID=90262 RepID=A0A1X2IY45_9FUNG|nr:PIN domain-like protein [Absidia repens]